MFKEKQAESSAMSLQNTCCARVFRAWLIPWLLCHSATPTDRANVLLFTCKSQSEAIAFFPHRPRKCLWSQLFPWLVKCQVTISKPRVQSHAAEAAVSARRGTASCTVWLAGKRRRNKNPRAKLEKWQEKWPCVVLWLEQSRKVLRNWRCSQSTRRYMVWEEKRL